MMIDGLCEHADFKVFLPEIYISAVSALKWCLSGGDLETISSCCDCEICWFSALLMVK